VGLSEGLSNPDKKAKVVNDINNLIEAKLASKSGISGIALKTAFTAIKGIRPGYINYVVEQLLPQSFTAIDPIWNEGIQKGNPVDYLVTKRSETANALLSITDERIKQTQRKIVKGTYEKFRSSAQQHVEDAVPQLAKIIDEYTKI
jgi:hypothetical protein